MYKSGLGMPSRFGMFVLSVLIGVYAAIRWYYWLMPTAINSVFDYVFSVGFLGSLVMLILCCVGGALISFRNPRSSDYLIEMDDELRKVVWPKALPLFDPKTEAWGSTYVVIACSIFFTFFIWAVDLILQTLVTRGLFENLLFRQ